MNEPVIKTYEIFPLREDSPAALYGTWTASEFARGFEELGFEIGYINDRSYQVNIFGMLFDLKFFSNATSGSSGYQGNIVTFGGRNMGKTSIGAPHNTTTNNYSEPRLMIVEDYGDVVIIKFIGYQYYNSGRSNGMIIIDRVKQLVVISYLNLASSNGEISYFEVSKVVNNVQTSVTLSTTTLTSDNYTETGILVPYISEQMGLSGEIFTYKPSILGRTLLHGDLAQIAEKQPDGSVNNITYIGLGVFGTVGHSREGYVYRLGEVQ